MSEKNKIIVSACFANAENLLQAAKTILQNNNLPNIAFHLAVLSLEEFGKACMLQVESLRSPKAENTSRTEKRLDEHEWKIFWALWVLSFSANKITRQELENHKKLAQKIHAKRLNSLYVSHLKEEVIHNISKKEAENVIQLAEIRLSQKDHIFDLVSKEKTQELEWFLQTILNETDKKLVFCKKSLEKLAELDSVLAWVKWLQKEFSEADARVERLLHQEMTRKMPNGQQAYEPKWEIKIRLIAISHSVRQKDLNWWNEKSNQVKFFTTGKKGNKELLVNIYLPKIVHGRNLWYAGYGFTRVLLLALNIGSMGFFWWYDLSKNLFYEKITDIEEKAEFTINVANPLLQVDWENKSLQADSLSRIALCFEHLPGPDASTEEQKCYGEYFNALAFLAKSDMHLTYVINACDLFFRCLKSAMSFYGDLKGNTFAEAFNNFTQSFIPSSTDREWLITLSEKFQTERVADFSGITLDHILRVKLVCDAYFLNVFNRIDRKGDNKFK